jgi:hypothetical protein
MPRGGVSRESAMGIPDGGSTARSSRTLSVLIIVAFAASRCSAQTGPL